MKHHEMENSMKTIGIVAALALLAGCEGMNSISTVAPKFTGQPVEEMATFFGAPERVTEAGSLTFYEWRIGRYATEPDQIDVDINSIGNSQKMTGAVEHGNQKFLGCIVEAMVDKSDVVTRVTLDSRTGEVGDVREYWGCSKFVDDPFEKKAQAQKYPDQSSSLTVSVMSYLG